MSQFIDTDITLLLTKLDTLSDEKSPLWGKMTAQQMVEHLTDSLKISSGKIKLPLETPEEKLPKMLQFLESEHAMPRSFEVSFVDPKAQLRHDEMALAIDEFLLEWIDFEDYFSNPAASETVHPLYGALNYEQWLRLHSKHFTHHFTQFELIET